MTAERKPLIIRNLLLLGIYQLLGGVWGLVLMALFFFGSFDQSAIAMIFLLAGILLFGYSVYCGITCIKKEKNACYFSRVNQCLQLVSISVQYLGYLYVSGLGFFLGVNLDGGIGFNFDFETSSFFILLPEHSEDKIIALNLVALFLLFNFNVLIKERKQSDALAAGLTGDETPNNSIR